MSTFYKASEYFNKDIYIKHVGNNQFIHLGESHLWGEEGLPKNTPVVRLTGSPSYASIRVNGKYLAFDTSGRVYHTSTKQSASRWAIEESNGHFKIKAHYAFNPSKYLTTKNDELSARLSNSYNYTGTSDELKVGNYSTIPKAKWASSVTVPAGL